MAIVGDRNTSLQPTRRPVSLSTNGIYSGDLIFLDPDKSTTFGVKTDITVGQVSTDYLPSANAQTISFAEYVTNKIRTAFGVAVGREAMNNDVIKFRGVDTRAVKKVELSTNAGRFTTTNRQTESDKEVTFTYAYDLTRLVENSDWASWDGNDSFGYSDAQEVARQTNNFLAHNVLEQQVRRSLTTLFGSLRRKVFDSAYDDEVAGFYTNQQGYYLSVENMSTVRRVTTSRTKSPQMVWGVTTWGNAYWGTSDNGDGSMPTSANNWYIVPVNSIELSPIDSGPTGTFTIKVNVPNGVKYSTKAISNGRASAGAISITGVGRYVIESVQRFGNAQNYVYKISFADGANGSDLTNKFGTTGTASSVSLYTPLSVSWTTYASTTNISGVTTMPLFMQELTNNNSIVGSNIGFKYSGAGKLTATISTQIFNAGNPSAVPAWGSETFGVTIREFKSL
jgi:hypothetical protein